MIKGGNISFSPDQIIDSHTSPDYYAAPRCLYRCAGKLFHHLMMIFLRNYGQAYFHLDKKISKTANDNHSHLNDFMIKYLL